MEQPNQCGVVVTAAHANDGVSRAVAAGHADAAVDVPGVKLGPAYVPPDAAHGQVAIEQGLTPGGEGMQVQVDVGVLVGVICRVAGRLGVDRADRDQVVLAPALPFVLLMALGIPRRGFIPIEDVEEASA